MIYRLQSIVVHDGDGYQGHYYNFMKQGSIWRKFSDAKIVEVSEREVFKIAEGGP